MDTLGSSRGIERDDVADHARAGANHDRKALAEDRTVDTAINDHVLGRPNLTPNRQTVEDARRPCRLWQTMGPP